MSERAGAAEGSPPGASPAGTHEVASGPSGGADLSSLESGFLRLAIGLATVAWLSLLLAELGWLSAGSLLGVLVVAAGVAWRVPPRRPTPSAGTGAGPAGRSRPGWREPAGAAVVLAVALRLFFPAYETVVWADDSTAYLGFASRIEESGALVFEDPLLERLPDAQRARLFRNATPLDTTGEYVRFPGGFLIPDVSGSEVTAGFSPLFPVLLAVSGTFLGPRGMFLVAPLFATLAVVTVLLLATRLGGARCGWLAAALLTVSLPQIWFARYGLPEPVAQFFLLAGVLALVASRDRRSPVLPAVGGALLGLSALAKVDLLVLAGASLVVFTGAVLAVRGRRPRHLGWFLGGFTLPALHLVVHYSIFPSHYTDYVARRVRESFLGEIWGASTGVAGGIDGVGGGIDGLAGWIPGPGWTWGAAGPGVVLLGAACLALRRRQAGRRHRLQGALLLGLALLYFATYLASTDPIGLRPVSQLGSILSWPLVALALLGAGLLASTSTVDWRDGLLPALAGVVCLHYLYNPHTSAGELWSFRRFLPVVVPAAVVLGAAATVRLVGRMPPVPRRATGGVLAAALVLLVGTPSLVLLGERPWGGAAEWTREFAARFPDDSLVLVSPELAGTHLATSLAYLNGLEAVLVQDRSRRPAGGAVGTDDLHLLVQDALGSGREAWFVVGTRAFGLYAPRLALERRHEDALVVTVRQETPSGSLRAARRSTPISVIRVGLRPGGPPTSIDLGDPLQDMVFLPRGFHAPERDPTGPGAFRWTRGTASLTLPAFTEARLLLAAPRPPGVEAPGVTIETNAGPGGRRRVTEVGRAPREPSWVTVPGPDVESRDAAAGRAPVELTIRTDTFNPGERGLSGDTRDLGVAVYAVELRLVPPAAPPSPSEFAPRRSGGEPDSDVRRPPRSASPSPRSRSRPGPSR